MMVAFDGCWVAMACLGLALTAGLAAADVAGQAPGADPVAGVVRYHLASPYQAGPTVVRVLAPQGAERGATERDAPHAAPAAREYEDDLDFRLLLILPVETGLGQRWGDPLAVMARANLHEKHKLICLYPTFTDLPWHADHPTDPAIAQERHLLQTVLPWAARQFRAAPGRAGRLLVGFSKSGWGAVSLLLRHPETFERAAAWDAPLMKAKPDQFGMQPIFATQANFEQYQLTRLAASQAESLRRTEAASDAAPRLLLAGAANFEDHHDQFAALLRQLKIPHVNWRGPKAAHHWQTGWLPPAVAWLATGRATDPEKVTAP